MYLLGIALPILVLVAEKKGHNFSEKLSEYKAKFFLLFKDDQDAVDELINLVTKYPESYTRA